MENPPVKYGRIAMQELERAAGRAIAARRRRAGLTQESLAEACGLHSTYISQLERGLKSPTLRVLFRLAGAMGVSPSALIKAAERELVKASVHPPH
jgi:transcriptional regulator with XRE-family HTH domain